MRLAKKLMFVIFLTNISGVIYSQTTTTPTEKKEEKKEIAPEDTANIESKWPTIYAGAGVLLYLGDLGKGIDVSGYSRIRGGYHLGLEKRFNAAWGVGLNMLYGKLACSERSNEPTRNLNFESPIIQIGASAIYHFDDNKLMKRSSVIGPYAGLGISFLSFNPKGDLRDANNNPYNYWTDGSIRDKSQATSNYFESNVVKRDYTYETLLSDSTITYSKTTFAIPVTIGSNFQFSENWHGMVFASYNLTFSDYIDNYKGKAGYDAFLHTGFSLRYNFALKVIEAPQFESVDMLAIDQTDSDGDGVKDAIDECLDTPIGIKVDSKGCPEDDDLDGVPNYMDKEPKSKRGAFVDGDGVTMSEMKLIQRYNEYDAGASRSTLTFEFADYDKNKDGFIAAEEMKAALDDFFAGKSKLDTEKLQNLITFYLRQ